MFDVRNLAEDPNKIMPGNYGNEEEQSRKLFIGGISFETTDESLRAYFEKHGNITDCVVIKDSSTGKSKGFGFVTYETEKEADACMADRPHELNERTIDVKRAVSREESSKPGAHVQVKKVFVGGIKGEITEDDLKSYFGPYGEITEVEIPIDKTTSKQRGFAFVTFDDYDPVDKLVAKRDHEIVGKPCEVKKALSKQEMEKAKYRGRGGGYSNRGGYTGPGYGGWGGSGYYGGYNDGYGYHGGYGGGWDEGYQSYGPPAGYRPMRGGRSRSGAPYGGNRGYNKGYGGGGYADDEYEGYGGGGYGGNYSYGQRY